MEKLFKILITVLGICACLLLALPLLALFLKIEPASFFKLLGQPEVTSPLILSIITSTISTFIALFLGIAAAYVLSFKNIPGRQMLGTLATLPMVLPPSVAGYLLLITFGRYGLVGHLFYIYGISIMFTTVAIVLAQVFVILPFVINSVRASFEEIDPNYERVAVILGASKWQTFKEVILPLAKNGIITGTVMAFARAMGEFGATMLVSGLKETMPIAIYRYAMSGKGVQADILSAILIIVSFGLLLAVRAVNCIQKQNVKT